MKAEAALLFPVRFKGGLRGGFEHETVHISMLKK
jgi:hypothetical protein